MMYVVGLLNHLMYSKGYIPKTVLTGEITDVSPYLHYHFWQEIFVESPKGCEQLAYWCGLAEKQGDFLTYHILLRDTEQLVQCSNVCPVKDSLFPNRNQHQPPADGDTTLHIQQLVVHTITDFVDDALNLPQFSLDELIGMSYVRQHDARDYHAKVICKVLDQDARDHQEIKFLLSLGDGKLENSSHITNYLISFLKRNRPPTMAKLTYLTSIVSLTIRAPQT